MKYLLMFLVVSNVFAVSCPSNLLVKKIGAKTYYTTDLKSKFSASELTKFGCAVNPKVMSKSQAISLIDAQAAASKAKL